jgi:hypothetical protein
MFKCPKLGRAVFAALVPCVLTIALVPLSAATVSAASSPIVFSGAPGTSAPPPMLGPYTMTPFEPDSQAVGESVSSVAGPTGTLGFSPSLEHCLTPNGCWQTWSNNYSGDVYATAAGSITLTLPPATRAFYFYAEPDQFMTFTMTATSSDGTTSGSIPVAGLSGARYFGFYSTGSASLTTITVSGSDPDGFAVGEFGVSNGSEHYVINAEAWIPFKAVVDPYFPGSTPYAETLGWPDEKYDPNCYTLPHPTVRQLLDTTVSSTYAGDGHTGFGGGYRLRTEVSFDFNPFTDNITNFTKDAVPAFGTSHRNKVYTLDGKVLATCMQAGDTTNIQTAHVNSGASFTLGYSGGNPLAKPYAPPAHAAITGRLATDGSLTLTYETTDFPSQGIQVSINGHIVGTDIENDASCIGAAGVLGIPGILRLASGLIRTESGSVTIDPNHSSTVSNPSPLC